jgi:phosphoglycolate phosphatase
MTCGKDNGGARAWHWHSPFFSAIFFSAFTADSACSLLRSLLALFYRFAP